MNLGNRKFGSELNSLCGTNNKGKKTLSKKKKKKKTGQSEILETKCSQLVTL